MSLAGEPRQKWKFLSSIASSDLPAEISLTDCRRERSSSDLSAEAALAQAETVLKQSAP